ncbi:MAG: ATP-binding protein [Gammaproteobacteria bacterium]
MYLRRRLLPALETALNQFPVVLVTGPRQSGKTTFLREEFGERFAYVTFDDPLTRTFAVHDPQGFLAPYRDRPVILDEIQYVPELLPYLKMAVDQNRQRFGWWLLTGSQQFPLMKNVSESLAGRIALLELLPFSHLEYAPARETLEARLWRSDYPEPALAPAKRELWLRSYVQTYVERDVRLMHNIQDLRAFELFLSLCAGRHGQEFSRAALARECGVSEPTVKTWGHVLAASYILYFLAPYHRNYGKRLVKTPKLYLLDAALAAWLTRQPSPAAALAGNMGGALFEGWVVSEAVKTFALLGRTPDLFFWRSHDGLEVDLIVQAGSRFFPIEIKLTATPTLRYLEPLNRFKELAGAEAAATGVLVCRVEQPQSLPHGNRALPWEDFSAWLRDQLAAPA